MSNGLRLKPGRLYRYLLEAYMSRLTRADGTIFKASVYSVLKRWSVTKTHTPDALSCGRRTARPVAMICRPEDLQPASKVRG